MSWRVGERRRRCRGHGTIAGVAADPVPDAGQRRPAAGGGSDQAAAEGPADDPRARSPHAHRQDLQRPPARLRPPPQEDHRPLAQALPSRQVLHQVRPHRLNHSRAQVASSNSFINSLSICCQISSLKNLIAVIELVTIVH